MYVEYKYSGPGQIIHASDFMFGIDMCLHVLYIYGKYIWYLIWKSIEM